MSPATPRSARTRVPAVRRPPSDLSVIPAEAPPVVTPGRPVPVPSPAPPATPVPPLRSSRAARAAAQAAAARGQDLALLPNLLIPGVSHAGAGMLAGDLGRHRQLCLPSSRQVGRFTPLRYGRPVEVRAHDYDRYFATWSGQRYRLETSPDYFDGGRPMAEALNAALPGLRVIFLLRDPAHRLWTGYADQLARRRLPSAITFDTFVDRCLALRANGADRFEGNRHFRALSSGFYIDFLPAWLEVFGDRLKVVFTEDLFEEPGSRVASLFTWLGLDPAETVPADPAEEELRPGYPQPVPAGPSRRFWLGLRRNPAGRRRGQEEPAGAPSLLSRRCERTQARVRGLYTDANAQLAGLLRDHGLTTLPAWLTEPGV